MIGAPSFKLVEFRVRSNRPLSMNEVGRAEEHARLLQIARDAVNDTFPRSDGREWLIAVTSYLRPDSTSNHRDGAAVDWVVLDPVTKAWNARYTKWARDYLATHKPSKFSRLLFESDHVHHVLAGTDSFRTTQQPALILDQTGVDADGRPTFAAAILPGLDTRLSMSVVLIGGALLFLLLGK